MDLQYELSRGAGNCSSDRSQKIIEQSVPCARREIPNGETYNFYGDSARSVEIKTLGGQSAFISALSNDVRRDGVCIDKRFGYSTKRNGMLETDED